MAEALREPSPSGYDGRVDGGAHPALDLLLERGWSKDIVRDGDGTPLDCTACPFSSRSIEPYEQISNDVTEAHYACSLLGRVVWGEDAPCKRCDWIRAETRREQEMTTEGYVRKHMAAHLPPIDRLAGAFKHIPVPVQLIKIMEEVGEAGEAHIGIEGWNPRKGATHTIEDFHKELLDVALTALMLYRNTGGGPPLARLSAHIEDRWARHEREVVKPQANVPRDARGVLVRTRNRVVMDGVHATGMTGEVKAMRSGQGVPEPQACVLWSDGHESWVETRKLAVWLHAEPEGTDGAGA